jgi:putative transposase
MIETIHLKLLPATVAGWVNLHQTQLIRRLIEENRVLEE